MSRLINIIKRTWRESREANKIVSIPLAILFVYLIESGKSRFLIKLNTWIRPVSFLSVSYYYLAHAYFLNANYELSRYYLEKIIARFPNHADATYLLCEIDCLQGKKDVAWKRVTLLVKNNSRLKTWLVMANLVENENEFLVLYNTWQQAIKVSGLTPYHLDVNGYIATGALRAGLYGKAEAIWKDVVNHIAINSSIPRNKSVASKFNAKHAEKALLSLKKIFDSYKINFFLVSGTLLGCIREGHILRHDNDADIGVWNDISPSFINEILRKSGEFYIQASRSTHTIRAKHVNGSSIDIFFHYRESNDYWHGGVKLKWSNTPFNLVPYSFLGQSFNIPEDYDLYLKENYGNWRLPKTDFDSSVDTTNATILNQYEMQIHYLKQEALKLLQSKTKMT